MLPEQASCRNCELWRGATQQVFPPTRPCSIMLVGEAPGENEDRTGTPFVGEAGQLLNALLDQAGLKREDVFVTNAVKCRPPKNRKPTAKEINACKPNLAAELQSVSPDIVIALGNEAMKSLTGRSGITKFRGSMQELHETLTSKIDLGTADANKVPVMPTLHPAFALRYPEHEPEIVQDITTALRTLRGGFTTILAPWTVFDPHVAGPGSRPNPYSPVWAYDIETNARELHDPELEVRFLAIDDGQHVIQFVGEHVETAVEIMDDYLRSSGETLVDGTRGLEHWLVGHNASGFDRMVLLEKYGLNLRSHDTQLLAHLVDEVQPLKLQDLAVKYLGVAPWKDGFDVDFWRRGPQTGDEWQAAFDYCARDTRYTYHLFLKLWEEADAGEKRLYRDHNLPASRALAKMSRNGVYISIPNATAAIDELEVEQQCALLMLKNATNPNFNPGSHVQVRELLFSDLMLPRQGKTKGDESSTDVEALKRIRAMNLGGKIPDWILAYREAGTLLAHARRYRDQAAKGYEDKSGFFHPSITPPWVYPSFSMTSTDTGRTSSYNPNLQNVPRDPRVRSVIAAPPGYVLIEVDGNQMEMRFAGEFAGPDSPLFREYLKPNPDVHMTMAMRLTHKTDPKLVTKDERSRAKPPNFSYLYNPARDAWRTYQRIALTDYDLVVDEKEARYSHDAFREWGVSPWWDRKLVELNETGCVTTIFGRRRRLPNIRASDDYARLEAWRQGINFDDQSAASDYFLLFLTQITGRGFHIIGAIHDAALVLVPDDPELIKSASAWLKYDFEVTTRALVESIFGYKFAIPLVADVSVGRWWGDKK